LTQVEVAEGEGGRLDTVLARRLELSRTRVQRLISQGRVTVDGRLAKKSESVEPGACIEVDLPPPEPVEMEPEDLPLDIVYQDADLLVVDKPAGMVVHPAPGHRRLRTESPG